MTGLPDLNYPAFDRAAMILRDRGFHVENPAENPAPSCGSWAGYMRLSLAQIIRCDALATLDGWHASRGAALEIHVAAGLGLEIRPVDFFITREPTTAN